MNGNRDGSGRKHLQSMAPLASDILWHACCIWHRDPNCKWSTQTEDTEFHATFGCGILVFLSLWSTLKTADLLPDGGTIDHLLWTLLFLKAYSNQKALCSLAGGVDATTF